MSPDNQERRRYFRVNDTLDLAYRLVDQGAPKAAAPPLGRFQSVQWQKLDAELQLAIDEIAGKDPEVARVLEIFNRKINLLSDQEGGSLSGEFLRQTPALVNISACGMAFHVPEPVSVGAQLELLLRLYPGQQEVHLAATVIECESAADSETPGRYLARIDFTAVEDATQEILIQHVLKCQSRQLKRRRQNLTGDSD